MLTGKCLGNIIEENLTILHPCIARPLPAISMLVIIFHKGNVKSTRVRQKQSSSAIQLEIAVYIISIRAIFFFKRE